MAAEHGLRIDDAGARRERAAEPQDLHDAVGFRAASVDVDRGAGGGSGRRRRHADALRGRRHAGGNAPTASPRRPNSVAPLRREPPRDRRDRGHPGGRCAVRAHRGSDALGASIIGPRSGCRSHTLARQPAAQHRDPAPLSLLHRRLAPGRGRATLRRTAAAAIGCRPRRDVARPGRRAHRLSCHRPRPVDASSEDGSGARRGPTPTGRQRSPLHARAKDGSPRIVSSRSRRPPPPGPSDCIRSVGSFGKARSPTW